MRPVPGHGPRRQRRLRRAMTVPQAFAHAIPDALTDAEAAPLLCAGAIGYRSLRLAELEDGQSLGLTGFGASAHLVLKLVRHRFPGDKGLRVRSLRRGARLRPRAGRGLGRRHRRACPAATRCDHRHDPGLDTGRRGTREPRARRAAGHQRDPQGRSRQGCAVAPRLSDAPLAARRRSRASPTSPGRRARVPSSSRPRSRSSPRSRNTRSRMPNQALIELKAKKIRGAKVLRVT